MSSLYATDGGAVKIGYVFNGKSKVLHLGKNFPLREGREIQRLLDLAVASKIVGESLSVAAVNGLKRLPERIRESFRRQGLFDFGGSVVGTFGDLGRLIENWDVSRDMKRHYRDAYRHLLEVYETTDALLLMDKDAAVDFADYLLRKRNCRLAEKTVYNDFNALRRLFDHAQEKGLTLYNPFQGVKAGRDAGEPSVYVSRETVDRVIDICRKPEMRLALTFARYAGVRMPSEIKDLRREDVESDRFHVRKGKTGARTIPLFPRVAAALSKYGNDNSEWVFPEVHAKAENFVYDQVKRTMLRHGMEPWPKLMNSLRASCITEFAHKNFHEVTLNAVFGNSERIRKKHYVKIRDEEIRSLIDAGNSESSKRGGTVPVDLLSQLLPLLSKEEVLRLWEDSRTYIER